MKSLVIVLIFLLQQSLYANERVTRFPIEQYNQDVDYWVKNSKLAPNEPLISTVSANQH